MSLQVEKLEKNTAKLTIEVPAEKFDAGCDRMLTIRAKADSISRASEKAKLPLNMIKKMYGAGVFYEDAADEVIDAELSGRCKGERTCDRFPPHCGRYPDRRG